MKWLQIIAIAGMFSGLIGARFISERALTLLSDKEKLALVDGFATNRKYGSLPFIAIMLLFFAVPSLPRLFVLVGAAGVTLLFVGYLAWKHRYVHRVLRELSISPGYIAAARRAQWVMYAGWTVFFIAIVLSAWE